MTEKKKDLSAYQPETIPSGDSMKIGVVVSEWNPKITNALRDACVNTLIKHGVDKDNITVIHVPGTYELTSGAALLLQKTRIDGVVCLGCVIKGETRHDEYINAAVAQGLSNLAITSNKPVIFGVLTTENMEQAVDRSGGKHGNKGTEAAVTVLKMIGLFKSFTGGEKKIGF